MTFLKKSLILLSLALVIISQANANHVVTLTTENFEILTSEGKWILDLYERIRNFEISVFW